MRIVDIKRFAVHDGDGVRTTVFLKGCSLHCRWCHNPESISPQPQLGFYAHQCLHCGACVAACAAEAHTVTEGGHRFDRSKCLACAACANVCPAGALEFYGKDMDTDTLVRTLLEDKAFYAASGGGITLSGGECLLQAADCAALLRRMHAHGVHTAVDTCGEVPQQALDAVLPYTDLFLYDLKHIDSAKHRTGTGKGYERILRNLHYLADTGKPIEIRIPLIIGFNDDAIAAMGAFLRELPGITRVKVLPYHDYARGKYAAIGAADTMPPMAAENGLHTAIATLQACGLTVTE
ncbi:MAG TPA: glycyl-radical enzyme activating protein [Armatimonadota bacterium]|nr:glycyl-radical enzyme activating protein [Armatimonadota bacterium]